MKKFIVIIIFFVFCIIFCGCNADNRIDERYQLIRVHIRADSNDTGDQNVKLKIRDKVVDYLTPNLQHCTTTQDAYNSLSGMLDNIKNIADKELVSNGFSYKAKVKLNNEYFPTRSYEGIVVESGYYDALIIELGSGKGDNWWCVVYPPLCFIEADKADGFKYKSKLLELWNAFFGK